MGETLDGDPKTPYEEENEEHISSDLHQLNKEATQIEVQLLADMSLEAKQNMTKN